MRLPFAITLSMLLVTSRVFCDVFTITSPSDNGSGTDLNSLSFAIISSNANGDSSDLMTFNVPGNTVTFTGNCPTINPTVAKNQITFQSGSAAAVTITSTPTNNFSLVNLVSPPVQPVILTMNSMSVNNGNPGLGGGGAADTFNIQSPPTVSFFGSNPTFATPVNFINSPVILFDSSFPFGSSGTNDITYAAGLCRLISSNGRGTITLPNRLILVSGGPNVLTAGSGTTILVPNTIGPNSLPFFFDGGVGGVIVPSNAGNSNSELDLENAVTIQVTSDGNLGVAAGPVIFGASVQPVGTGATIQATTGFASSARPTTLNHDAIFAASSGQTLTWTGNITSNAGSVLLIQGPGTVNLTGTNALAGLTIQSGTAQITSSANLGVACTVTFNASPAGSATLLQLLAANTFSQPMVLTSNGTVSTGGANTWNGGISGAGSLTLQAGGTFVFGAGTNNYTGGTIITGGTTAQAAAAPGTGAITFASGGGTLHATAGFTVPTGIVLNATGTITLDGVNTLIIPAISGGSTLNLNAPGPGFFTVQGSNASFSGPVNLNTGTVNVSANTALGTGNFQITSPSTLNAAASASLPNNITFSGATPNVQVAAGATLSLTGAINLNGSSPNLTVGAGSTLNATGAITGNGSVVIGGVVGGTVIFSNAANTYGTAATLNTTINNGATLQIVTTANLGNATSLLAFNTVGDNSILHITGTGAVFARNVTIGGTQGHMAVDANQTADWTGQISGTRLVIEGGGTFILDNATNNYVNTTINSSSTAKITADANLGAPGGALTFNTLGNNSVLRISGNIPAAAARLTTITGTGIFHVDSGFTATWSGQFTGGTLQLQGGGILALSNAANAFSALSIAAGTVQFAAAGNLNSPAAPISLSNAGILEATATATIGNAITLGSGGSSIKADPAANPLTLNGVISGSSLTLFGGGTIVLGNASNSYLGTVINGTTTVQVAVDGNLGQQAAVALGAGSTLELTTNPFSSSRNVLITSGIANITTDPGVTATWSGPFGQFASGSGLIKKGTGTLVMGGATANSYTGSTEIQAGILKLTGTQTLSASSSLTVDNGATFDITGVTGSSTVRNLSSGATGNVLLGTNSLVVISSSNTTVAGPITGTATGNYQLIKQGTAQLTLMNAANSFTGTLIEDGTLFLGAAGVLPSGKDIAFGATSSSSNPILNLNNFNQMAGTLQTILPSPGTGGQILLGSATLTLNNATPTPVTYTGSISGTGSVVKSNSYTQTFLGSSSYSGGTTIDGGILNVFFDAALGATSGTLTLQGGTLQVSGSFSTARPISILPSFSSPSSFKITSGNTLTLNGTNAMTGTSLLSLQGGGTLIIAANELYSGTLGIIDNSTLQVDAIFPGSVFLNAGTLKGIGSVGSVTNNGGIVAPGDSIGTLTVNGSYTQGPGGSLNIEINAVPAGDLLQVQGVPGTASLNGTLNVFPAFGNYFRGFTYTILTATSGVSGTFPNVNIFAPRLQMQVIYNPNSVVLLMLNNEFFSGLNITQHNPRNVLNYLEGLSFPDNADITHVVQELGNLGPNPHAITAALDQLHPAIFGAFDPIINNESAYIASLFSQRCLECCRPRKQRFMGWVEPIVLIFNQRPTGEQKPFNAEIGDFLVGADGTWGDFMVGASVGGGATFVQWKQNRGHSNREDILGALYATFRNDYVCLEGSFLAAYNFFHTDRHINFGTLHRDAAADYNGMDWNAHFGFRGEIDGGNNRIFKPYFLGDYTYNDQYNFNESGARSLNLHVFNHRGKWLRGEAGLILAHKYELACGCITPAIGGAWAGNASMGNRNYNTFFRSEGGLFNVRTWHRFSQRFIPSGEVIWEMRGERQLSFRYAVEIGSRLTLHKMDLRYGAKF